MGQANIAAFGGDPANVTFRRERRRHIGQLPAGLARRAGLFAKAIRRLGSAAATASPGRRGRTTWPDLRGDQRHQGRRTAAAAALRALPADTVNAPIGLGADHPPSVSWTARSSTEDRPGVRQGGRGARALPEGGNSYELSLFPLVIRYPGPTLSRLGAYRDRVVALYGGVADAKTAADVTTDIQITEPNRYLARQMAAAGQPVFVYHFSYVPASERSTALGASHGAEVAYVFATLRCDRLTTAGAPIRPRPRKTARSATPCSPTGSLSRRPASQTAPAGRLAPLLGVQ